MFDLLEIIPATMSSYFRRRTLLFGLLRCESLSQTMRGYPVEARCPNGIPEEVAETVCGKRLLVSPLLPSLGPVGHKVVQIARL